MLLSANKCHQPKLSAPWEWRSCVRSMGSYVGNTLRNGSAPTGMDPSPILRYHPRFSPIQSFSLSNMVRKIFTTGNLDTENACLPISKKQACCCPLLSLRIVRLSLNIHLECVGHCLLSLIIYTCLCFLPTRNQSAF